MSNTQLIQDLIENNTYDNTLTIYHTINTDTSIAIANELINKPHITTVRLSRNNIEDEGAIALAKVKTIKSLDLAYNYIEDKGAKALAENTTLEELYLDENPISTPGAKAFLKNNTLEKLGLHRLEGNRVPVKILKEVQAHIGANRNLKKLKKGIKKQQIAEYWKHLSYRPGSLAWAKTMGDMAVRIGEPPKTMDKCLNMSYMDEEGMSILYNKKQLYAFAEGMGLIPDKNMTKKELCRLITTGIKMGKEAPF